MNQLVDQAAAEKLSIDYTAAWNSGFPERVASYYDYEGSLKVNDDEPAIGREAITEVANGFMTAFPDLVLEFNGLEFVNDRVNYHWTFKGTNTGPGGTGSAVEFSGFESWKLGESGLIFESLGHFDAADYERQLASGASTN